MNNKSLIFLLAGVLIGIIITALILRSEKRDIVNMPIEPNRATSTTETKTTVEVQEKTPPQTQKTKEDILNTPFNMHE